MIGATLRAWAGMAPLAVGDRVTSRDPEDDGADGTVAAVTPTGGVMVAWDGGRATWTTATNIERRD